MAPVNLLGLNSNELKVFLDSFDYVFSDCDGVLWLEEKNLDAGNFIKLMKECGKSISYVSNNSCRTRKHYEDLFRHADIEDGCENLTTPCVAMAEFLKSNNFNKKVYCVTNMETMRYLEANGFKCENGPDFGPEYYGDYLQYLDDDEEIGAVVFDCDIRINMPKLYKAKTYLSRPDVYFLNGATDKHIIIKPGCKDLGLGLFPNLVAEQIGRGPIQLGKPGTEFGEFAMKRAGATDPGRVLFIVDTIDTDIGLGKAMGFKTLLILTGASEDAMKAHPIKPDYYAPSLASLVPKLKSLQ